MIDKKFILIGHKKRHGKDTFANYLAEYLEDHGKVEMVSFATPLKMIVADMFDVTYDEQEYAKNNGRLKAFLKYRRLVFLFANFRVLLQKFGSGKMKYYFGNTVWKNALLKSVENSDADYIIVPDFRFPYEEIDGSTTVKVYRPSIKSNDTHDSETSLDDFSFKHIIDNDQGLKQLRNKARGFGEYIRK